MEDTGRPASVKASAFHCHPRGLYAIFQSMAISSQVRKLVEYAKHGSIDLATISKSDYPQLSKNLGFPVDDALISRAVNEKDGIFSQGHYQQRNLVAGDGSLKKSPQWLHATGGEKPKTVISDDQTASNESGGSSSKATGRQVSQLLDKHSGTSLQKVTTVMGRMARRLCKRKDRATLQYFVACAGTRIDEVFSYIARALGVESADIIRYSTGAEHQSGSAAIFSSVIDRIKSAPGELALVAIKGFVHNMGPQGIGSKDEAYFGHNYNQDMEIRARHVAADVGKKVVVLIHVGDECGPDVYAQALHTAGGSQHKAGLIEIEDCETG